jgi:hypothetical protein
MADDDPQDIPSSLLHSFVAICAQPDENEIKLILDNFLSQELGGLLRGRFTVQLLLSQSENFIFCPM